MWVEGDGKDNVWGEFRLSWSSPRPCQVYHWHRSPYFIPDQTGLLRSKYSLLTRPVRWEGCTFSTRFIIQAFFARSTSLVRSEYLLLRGAVKIEKKSVEFSTLWGGGVKIFWFSTLFYFFWKVAWNDLIHPEMQRKFFPILCTPLPLIYLK